eukprot:g5495.t1
MLSKIIAAVLTICATVHSARVHYETDQGLPGEGLFDWKQAGRSPAPTPIPLILHLVSEPEGLATLEKTFWRVSDPDDSDYGSHLSQDQVTALVAHPEAKLRKVLSWLSKSGATRIRVGAHRDSIKFVAAAKDVELMFSTKMYLFQHKSRAGVALHRAATRYSLPGDIASSVALVSGLLRLPNLERLGGIADRTSNTNNKAGGNAPWPSDCKGCSEKVTPGVLSARYAFPPASKNDAPSTLAISEFQGQVWDQADLDKFSSSCSLFNITVNHENGTISPGKQCKIPVLGTQFCGEALLDIEYAKAVAGPSVELTDIYVANYNLLEWATRVENIDDANLIGVHSVSYGNDEKQQTGTQYMDTCNTAFMKIGVRGVSILFASGDQGVCGRSGCGFGKNVRFHPDFPAGSPYITSVGGTNFVTRSTIGDESVWDSSGGGFSDTFAIPAYQTAAVAKYKSSPAAHLPPQSMWNNTGRGYPDVAALGGPSNSYCIGAGSMLLGIYGTSAACPVTAAIFSRLNGVRVKSGGKNLGFLNPWIYKNAAAFNDVTQGTNNDGQANGFTAVAGWDAATGVGTPNYTKMLKAL